MNDTNGQENNLNNVTVPSTPNESTNDIPVLQDTSSTETSGQSTVAPAAAKQEDTSTVETLDEAPAVASDDSTSNTVNTNTDTSASANTSTTTGTDVGVNATTNNDVSNSADNISTNTSDSSVDGENKKMKEVEINYKPPGKFKIFLLILFFVFLTAYIIFLPEINSYIENYKVNKEAKPVEIITTGKLVCDLSRYSENLDFVYESTFTFTDSKLNKLSYTVTTKGDADVDDVSLEDEDAKCKLLKEATEEVNGVVISCNYSQGLQRTKQSFDFALIDVKKMDAAYAEAGGVVVEFENEENIDEIERNMKASGYTCERRK